MVKTRSQSSRTQIADYVEDFERKLKIQENSQSVSDWDTPGPFEFEFSFDDSIAAWNANKKRVGHSYIYVCGHILKSGKYCKNRITQYPHCHCHQHPSK